MYTQWWFIGLILLVTGCIGENPADKTTSSSPASATPTTPAATTPTASGTLSTQIPDLYEISAAIDPTISFFFKTNAQNNTPLQERDAADTESKLTKDQTSLKKWSAPETPWKYKNGAAKGIPVAGSNIKIKFDQVGSAIQTDGNHTVANLSLDQQCGIYIPAKTSIIASSEITMKESCWIDVRGRLSTPLFKMDKGSTLDLTNGYGLLVDNGITDLTYDPKMLPAGVLQLNPKCELRAEDSHITLHKGEINGTLLVSNATFNLQSRRPIPEHLDVLNNVELSLVTGKIQPLGDFPETLMTVNGPFKFNSGSTIQVFFNQAKATELVLTNPLTTASGKEASMQPIIEGKFQFIPIPKTLQNTTGDGILVVSSDIGFSEPSGTKLNHLIQNNRVLNKLLELQIKTISGKEGLYLTISEDLSAPRLLNAAPQIEDAVHQMHSVAFQQDLTNQGRLPLVRNDTYACSIIATQSASMTNTRGIALRQLGMRHGFRMGDVDLTLQQTFNEHRVQDPTYRFIPKASAAFWITKTDLSLNLLWGGVHSIGVSHVVVPTTLFQDGFQDIQPFVSMFPTLNIPGINSNLSISIGVRAAATMDWDRLSMERFDTHYGLRFEFKTPSFQLGGNILSTATPIPVVQIQGSYNH